jgi:hypothetical protein
MAEVTLPPTSPQILPARRAPTRAPVSRLSVAAASFMSAACLAAAGCGAHPCTPAKCPTATYSLRLLEDSTVNAGASALIEGFFTVQCAATWAARFNIGLSKLGDFRDWSAGTFTVVAPAQRVGLDYYPTAAPPPGPAGKECPVATVLDGIVLTVNVETATGAAAPYPQLVTGDFVRTFRLFDTTSVQARDATGAACDLALAAQVSLHFTQTTAEYVYDPNTPCICQ